jgi:branched-chain amino acid aminotransferase
MSRIAFPDGHGIFETMRVEDGRIAELSRHMRRATSSARALEIDMPDEEHLRKQLTQVLSEKSFELGRLRVCFSVSGMVIDYSEYSDFQNPANLTFHSTSQVSENSMHKIFPYDERFEILDTALEYGFDDAIVFNKENHITESAIANICVYIEGQWLTPPITAGVLPGIMRAIAVERLDVKVANIHISEIPTIEAAALLNSLKIAQPVAFIGDYRLPQLGQSTQLLAQLRSKVDFFSLS